VRELEELAPNKDSALSPATAAQGAAPSLPMSPRHSAWTPCQSRSPRKEEITGCAK